MKAQELYGLCQYINTMPFITLKDAEAGRVQVWGGKVRLATIVPGYLLGLEEEVALLSYNNQEEFRTSWSNIPTLISTLQQTGDWNEVAEALDGLAFFDGIPSL